MILTNDLNPTSGFTRILNEVIFNEALTAAEFRLWCQLMALPKGQKIAEITSVNDLDAALGLDTSTSRARRSALKAKGYLRIDGSKIVVTIPSEDFVPPEAKLTAEQQARHDLKEAWNKAKPAGYARMRNSISVKQLKTLQQHAEQLQQTDLVKFLTTVLNGCRADDWWAEKSLSFDNVFGTGNPTQRKFNNINKIYNLANSKQGKAAVWDINSDSLWLEWYESKGLDMRYVKRLDMERFDAWDHQVQNDGDKTIYIYTDERGVVVHWTYKELSLGVSYLPTVK